MRCLVYIAAIGFVLIQANNAACSVQIVGGSSLLTPADADQLGTWLGEGDITLTNIFTKLPDSYSADFHAAADYKGRTFTVIEVLSGILDADGTPFSTRQIIGGYNPQSWEGSPLYQYHITPLVSQRTAFLFNLTTSILARQNLDTSLGNRGEYQTFNLSGYGPSFGGTDLLVDLTLSTGFAATSSNSSYGPDNILGASSLVYGGIEVFTIANGVTYATPELASGFIWIILGVFGTSCRLCWPDLKSAATNGFDNGANSPAPINAPEKR